MFDVKKKHLYAVAALEQYHGMLPLDIYITLLFFNYDKEIHGNILMDFSHLSHFITECLVEVVTSDVDINLKEIDIKAKDCYISAVPIFGSKTINKIMLFKFPNNQILVSENKIDNRDGFKMKNNITKEYLMGLLFSVHNFALCLMNDIVQECNKAKKLNVIEEKCAIQEEDKKEKFDKENYVKL